MENLQNLQKMNAQRKQDVEEGNMIMLSMFKIVIFPCPMRMVNFTSPEVNF